MKAEEHNRNLRNELLDEAMKRKPEVDEEAEPGINVDQQVNGSQAPF